MGYLYDYTFFEKLKIDPKEHKILLTEPPSNPKENQVKMYTAMFEKYQFQAAKVNIQGKLLVEMRVATWALMC